jgi:hypothetical protein
MSAFDPKADMSSSGLLPPLNAIYLDANPWCNRTLKIGVVLCLGMGDATALQSKQQTD